MTCSFVMVSTALKTEVQQKIKDATHLLNVSSSSKDYQNEFLLNDYVDSFRKIIQTAVKQFRTYRPHNPRFDHIPSRLPHHAQSSNFSTFQDSKYNPFGPTPSHPTSSQQSNSKAVYDEEDDESKILEENEEKMAYITEELTEMKDMFVDLDDIIRDQQDMVDLIENSVFDSKCDVEKGAEDLLKSENTMKKMRYNRCLMLGCLCLVIPVFLLYLWITSRGNNPFDS